MPTILLVDDEDYIREIFTSALREFDVVAASSGAEAVELAGQQEPDLLITDFRMPDMDGLAVMHSVRELYPNVPVLVISGSLDAPPEPSGEFEFLRKPVRLSKLVARAKELLGVE